MADEEANEAVSVHSSSSGSPTIPSTEQPEEDDAHSATSADEEPWSALSVTRLQRNVRTRRLICLLEIASLAIGHSLGRSL